MMSCYTNEVPFLSVIIPGYNRFSYLQELVDSIHAKADCPFELIIHDDNSKDGTKDLLPKLNEKVSATIYSHGLNFGLAESINRLVRMASSNYILMLNADLQVTNPIFQDTVNVLQCPYIGYLTFMTVYGPSTLAINHNGTYFALSRGLGSGCALAFRKDVWNQVNGWANKTVATGNADVAFMTKIVKHGYFPATLVKSLQDPLIWNMSQITQNGFDSTIGRGQYDCSLPKLFNYEPYIKQSRQRYEDAANAMQITYKEPEGEVNIHFWHTFLNELIKEDFTVNWEIAQRYGHIKWKDQIEQVPVQWDLNPQSRKEPNFLEVPASNLPETTAAMVRRIWQKYYSAQNADELIWIADKVKKLNPTAILEIGVESGGTLKIWEQLLKQDESSILIGIDLSPNIICQTHFSETKISVTIINGDAHSPKVLQAVEQVLKTRKFDFIFIDSEHTSKAASLETEMYKHLLNPGGLIGYHDINCITEFLSNLDQGKLEIYHKGPPYSDFGAQNSPGIGIYYVD
jgi:glycosyltransferase involved in cell wall biosynthesis/predicted O-methyltransferase YrrM